MVLTLPSAKSMMPSVFSKEAPPINRIRAKKIPPLLPLIPEPEPEPEPKKGEYIKLDLRSVPDDPNSETYSLNIRYFDSGTPAQWIEWLKNYQKVQIGHSLNNGPR